MPDAVRPSHASRPAGGPTTGDVPLGVLTSVVCLALYVRTLTPGIAYPGGDGPELTIVADTLGVAHPTGYPLFTWLGFLATRLLPFGDPAYRTNLLSAITAATATGFLFGSLRTIGIGRVLALAAALHFAAAATVWRQSIITEVYAPNACAVAVTLWLLLRWGSLVEREGPSRRSDRRLAVFALSFGLSLGGHLSNLGFAPAFAVFVLLTDPGVLRRPAAVATAVGGFVLGAAQFVWLPLRAAVTDLYPNVPPTTWSTFYGYTLGAFRQLRFAYPAHVAPLRVVTYLGWLVGDFGVLGVTLGLLGMWALWWQDVARFLLLIGMYVVHVVFFTQLGVADPDVFFVPSHLLFAIFLGVGAQAVVDGVTSRLSPPPARARVAGAVLVTALFAVAGIRVARTLPIVDASRDTVVPDFYRSMFDLLPPGSAIADSRGAFGANLRYWSLLGLRPDLVAVLDRGGQAPPDRPLFATRQLLRAGALGAPPGTFPANAWFVPVLLGTRNEFVLHRVTTTPPALVVTSPRPQTAVERDFDGATLVGYDFAPARGATVPRVHMVTYWRQHPGRRGIVLTKVDDLDIESHDLGFDLLDRYEKEVGVPAGGVVVDDVDLVLPSTLPPGRHTVSIGMVRFAADGMRPEWHEVGTVVTP